MKENQNYYTFTDLEMEVDPNETLEEMESYSTERQDEEILKCMRDFGYFTNKYVKVQHYNKGAIRFRLYNYQKRLIEVMDKHQYVIGSKFRVGGFSTTAAIHALWEVLFQTDRRVLLLSKTDREALNLAGIVKDAVERFPRWLKPDFGKSNNHRLVFDSTNSKLMFYTPLAACGLGFNRLVIDEAAFIEKMAQHWSALFPVISIGAKCLILSTHYHPNTWFNETLQAARNGGNLFYEFKSHYFEHPDFADVEFVDTVKKNLGERTWKQEFLQECVSK